MFSFADLPEDAKVFDVDAIINLDTQKLQTETTGAKIIEEIQEWLLTRVSSQETAVLPDDKVQRLLVGVSISILHHSLLAHFPALADSCRFLFVSGL